MTLPQINPAALFDVAGKSALVVGATGAFGKVACATLGAAGARLTITAGNAAELERARERVATRGHPDRSVARRPNSEADSQAMVHAAVEAHGGLDILVVASGMNDVAPITDMSPERFRAVMQANVDGAWLIARAAGRA